MKKVLFITSRADFGGGPEHIYRLITNFSNNIITYIAAPEDYPYHHKYVEVLGEENVINIPHRKFEITALLRLKKFIKEKNINIIHSHGKGAGVYSRLLVLLTGVKCIHTLHGFHIGMYNTIQLKLYVMLEKFFSLLTYRLIAVSEGERDLLLKYNIAPQDKIKVIYNGVNVSDKMVTSTISKAAVKKIISFTRYDYQKNSELIVDIAKILKQNYPGESFEFHLFGEGEGINLFRRKIEENRLTGYIKIHDAVENPMDYLVDAFCYISTSRWEGLPLALLEAMSVGLPVIASNVVGNKDIIKNGEEGYLFDLDKPEDAAKYIFELCVDKNLWEKLSIAARKKVEEKFNINRMISETEKLYFE